ncbi:hypothetical protein BEWA_023870 [Theileria equi strain WA]|uniref:Uncharacterized protein n=1 Tax=Theileria equi strain WA TaxID=1537102 RepID=L0AWB8_THEEQ|nr:hypothetical protein BEWA_023870 [Theileria equi strain WA]AFZ79538.1 hypothetical protein BEWA_023870 [Theileria equi strain WA]|eukprot:XP_004829204.1 hypothetical protein BEWA_023870 [Theileria equi strain WA]
MYGVTAQLSRKARFHVSRVFQHVALLNGPHGVKSRFFSTLDDEKVENYYVLKDIRDSTKCTGFDEDDPRGKFTNRDDTVEEFTEIVDEKLPNVAKDVVPLYKKCKLTKTLIKVEIPIKKLDSEELVSSLLFLFPSIPFDVDVKDLFYHLNGGTALQLADDQIRNVKMFEQRVSELLAYNRFNLKQTLVVALIFDHCGLLTHELRNKLLLAMQLNIYAFRPYDIAVAVHIYGKVQGRYDPFINTLGLVFYDLMIGGKTSLCPNGPSLGETMAVLSSFTSVGFSTSKLTDPIFGYLYEKLNEMSESQMVFALKSFFTISKDAKFVELYSRILSILFNNPLLFVEKFQEHAQESLSSDFGIQPVSIEAYPKSVKFPSDIPSLLLLFDALSNCKSEFLISSVHNRIEFKRLWSRNIKTGNMPWKVPGVGRIEDKIDVQSEECPKLVVTYKSQLPKLYTDVSKLIKDAFGPTLSSSGIVKYIFEHNTAVVNALDKENIPYHVYFPYNSSIQAISQGVDTNYSPFPVFKIELDALLEYKETLMNEHAKRFHVNNLATFCKGLGIETETLEFIPKQIEAEEWVNEIMHGLVLGNTGLLEGCRNKMEFYNVKAMDIANCIVFINDYSRYADLLPVDMLSSLYYRLLFTRPTYSNSPVELLDKICPKVLVLGNSHIAYTEDSEFYKTAHGMEYYLPPPSIRSLFKGDHTLNSVIFYVISHHLHYYMIPLVSSMTESQIIEVNTLLQQLMHPFYALSKVESEPRLLMDVAYCLGLFNNKHLLHSNIESLYSLGTMEVMKISEEHHHIYTAFLHVTSLYLESLITEIDGSKLTLKSQVKLLRTVLMLNALHRFFQKSKDGKPMALVQKLLGATSKNFFVHFSDPQKEELDDRLTVEDDVLFLQVLSDILELDVIENRYKLLNHVILGVFRRIKYYSLEEIVPILSSLSSINSHFNGINIEDDEFLEQVSQSVKIVQGQLLESITSGTCTENTETSFTEQGKSCFLFFVEQSAHNYA